MLGNGKIDSLDTHLEQFKLNNQNSQNDLRNLLKEYSQLLDDYKDLKRAFETKGSRSPAKAAHTSKVHIDKARNAYVLVLVDGNDYIFNDELIREKEEGGMRAARMLNEAVEKYLHQSVPEAHASRIVVRIYADLTNLSKQLAKSKVTGLEKRSIAPFSAAFTRAISLFDFVDALDEEGTKFKIREQFKIACEDSACSHILYAACHDSAYLSQLVPFGGLRNKITLVQGAGWNSEFHQFNLNVTQFPTVFRWSDLPNGAPSTKSTHTNGAILPKPKATQKKSLLGAPLGPRQYDTWQNGSMSPRGSIAEFDGTSSVATNGVDTANGMSFGNKAESSQKSSSQLCKFFQKGFCRFGNKCTFQHIPASLNGITPQLSSPTTDRSNITAILPTTTATGYVPLNKHSQRLDNYIRPPTQEEWTVYNARFHKQKPCNSYQLQRVCLNFDCPYDHQELEPEARHVLEYVLKCSPCPKKSSCKSGECYYGHICQKDGCQGQMKGCKMKADLHAVDPKVASVVTADDLDGPTQGTIEGVDMPDETEYLW
ncbi:hypothetical protein GQ44DRAFT_826947 [Phaeosphaeriaceae sp. PMI808]|nr:hypothetical protein GQ44DRAFT_826947 [Phaeosphaeriaceae sp. PMI808]